MKPEYRIICSLTLLIIIGHPTTARQNNTFYEGFNLAFPTSLNEDDLLPRGLQMGFLFGGEGSSGFSMGPSFTYQGYGFNAANGGQNGYDKIKTAHNIYSFNLDSKIDFMNKDNLNLYLKPSIGVNVFNTRTFVGTRGYVAVVEWLFSALCEEDDDDCMEDIHDNRILFSKNHVTPNLAFTLGLDVPMAKDENRFYIELTYRSAGKAEYVPRDGVRLDPITYETTQSVLQFVSPLIGFSHSF